MLRAACRLVAAAAAVALAAVSISGAVGLESAFSVSTQVLPSTVEAGPLVGRGGSVVGEAPAMESPRAAGPSGGGVWAVVVGIDDYPGSGRDLRAGIADAAQMEKVLDLYGVPDTQRSVLVGDVATRDAVMGSFDWLADNAGLDSTVLLFFSGHVRQVGGDPDGDGEDVDEVLVLADDQTISDAEVAAALDGTIARRAWLAIAGCYAGGFDDAMAPGRILTGASPEGALAYENDRFRLTYLVEYMLKRAILEGAAPTSVQDAFAWALAALREDYPSRLPVMIDEVGGPLVLAGS